jgi:HEAT repeat protein
LNHSNPLMRELAVAALVQAGAPAGAVLIQALDEHQPVSVRIAAASGLGRIGADAPSALSSLAECLDSSDEILRWHSAFALSRVGTAAIPVLMTKLASADPAVQCTALSALGWIGTEAGAATEAVKRLVSSTSTSLRLAACVALIRITGDLSDGLPAMLAALGDRDENVRLAAVQRIGEAGRLAQPSASRLLQTLSDSSASVRAASALGLARINANGSEIVQALTGLLSDIDSEVQAAAGIALSNLGKDAEAALPQLLAMQNVADDRVAAIRKAAAEKISQGASK